MSPTDVYYGARVLLLGAGGFIGRRVAGMLHAAGAHVVSTVRPSGGVSGDLGGDVRAVDLRDDAAVAETVASCLPDVVFNVAGYGVRRGQTDDALLDAINSRLPARLCDALVACPGTHAWPGPRLVHVGSALEYGAVGGTLTEDVEPAPTSAYGRTKLAGTRAVLDRGGASGLRAVIARPFTVYGPGEHTGRLFTSILEAARGSEPLALTEGRQKRDFTTVDDVAEGLLRLGCASRTPHPVVNLATGRLTTVRAFVEIAAEAAGIAPERLEFGAIQARADEIEHAVVSVDRLRETVNWVPETDIRTGIRQALDAGGAGD